MKTLSSILSRPLSAGLLLLSGLFGAVSCKYDVPTLPGSGGKTCEIIIVTPERHWTGLVGDSIRSWFERIQPALNQPEPLFDLVNIEPKRFNESNMFQRHRNVFIVEFDTAAEPKLELLQDAWAFPQAVAKFSVPDTEAFGRLFSENKENLLSLFYMKEYQRIQKAFKSTEAVDVTERLRRQFGIMMVFPDGFDFAAAGKDFGWIRKESKDYGQGIIFSIHPYTSVEEFQTGNIIAWRNAMCRNIPGPAEGSYMSTELEVAEFYPQSRPVDINGLYAVETRGLWRLEGDFMGGPFVNYLIADTARRRLIMVDAYLYSPRKPKRDLLLQMEAVARSFKLSPAAIPQASLSEQSGEAEPGPGPKGKENRK